MSTVTSVVRRAVREGRKHLLEHEAKALCAEYGIPVTKVELAQNEHEASKLAKKIGFPVVLKIVSPDIIHKSDVGGVVIDVRSEKEVQLTYSQVMANIKKNVPDASVIGILIQEMAPQSTEVIIGAIKDPQFGPTLMFGLGGIFVEILEDVTFRIAPITEDEAHEMITEVKAYPILKGYRNTPPADTSALVEILMNTSRLVTEHQEIREIDLNPIMVYEKGAKVVDARVILE